jgi:hypothetical protein
MKFSARNSLLGGFFAAAVLSAGAVAQAAEYEVVAVQAQDVFIPDGFDDNDETVVVLDGYLQSGCYKLAQSEHRIDFQTNTVHVTQYARKYSGPCIMALIPYTTEVRLGVMPQGDYTVAMNDGVLTEKFKVREALNAGPDDFLYAPIDSVVVNSIQASDNGDYVAFLTGRFTTNCMAWEGTKVIDGGKTVVVQPIIKMLDLPVCEDATIPFRVAVDLPRGMVDGRHLLHTRSLNGRSVNTVFAVKGE